MITATAERSLRPLPLGWRVPAAGNVALVVPGAAVAVVIAAQEGRTVIAAVVGAVALLVVVLLVFPALRIRTHLDNDGITSFWTNRLGSVHIARDDVRRAVIRTIYNGDGVSSNRHLFLLDADDRTLFRMNDRWWTDRQLLAVAEHFGVAVETQDQPVHLGELRLTAPNQLRWSERHRLSALALLFIGVFAVCLASAALLSSAV